MHTEPGLHEGGTVFADLVWRNAPLRLECQWVGVRQSDHPVVVFLHEGLGSIAMWKDFPAKYCRDHGFTGLVFSRYGYGQSSPRPAAERWPVNFMHEQAEVVLPLLLSHLGIERPWLFGHSDGGSIALLYAAAYPDAVAGIIVVAPHILVEDVTIASIVVARDAYLATDLRSKLARHHADPDSAFRGWNDVWLDPAFRSWNIMERLARITCPVLAVQGEDDEYGSLQQIRGIRQQAPQTHLFILPQCGHSPHRDQPAALTNEAARFILRSN